MSPLGIQTLLKEEAGGDGLGDKTLNFKAGDLSWPYTHNCRNKAQLLLSFFFLLRSCVLIWEHNI